MNVNNNPNLHISEVVQFSSGDFLRVDGELAVFRRVDVDCVLVQLRDGSELWLEAVEANEWVRDDNDQIVVLVEA